jgi:hypothetical protein
MDGQDELISPPKPIADIAPYTYAHIKPLVMTKIITYGNLHYELTCINDFETTLLLVPRLK